MRFLLGFLLLSVPAFAGEPRPNRSVLADVANLRRQAVAMRTFARNNQNRLPNTLRELAPQYLPSLPLAAGSGQPFVYTMLGPTRFRLAVPGETYARLGIPAGYPLLIQSLTQPHGQVFLAPNRRVR